MASESAAPLTTAPTSETAPPPLTVAPTKPEHKDEAGRDFFLKIFLSKLTFSYLKLG